jgi:hypothetical protein
MRLIPPRQTDAIVSLAARVSALEGASYNTNSPVSMYKLFAETPTATDTFTISTHTYHVCGPNTLCGPNEIL